MVKIHASCGKRQLPGYIHADMADFPHIDHKDIFNLPYQPGTVSEMYCAHGIAYNSKEDVLKLLKHWFDIMKPGGTLRIATPNLGTIAQMLQQGYDAELFQGLLYGRMDVNGTEIFHKRCYTFDSLSRLLEMVGFNSVQKYRWQDFLPEGYDDHSRAYLPPMRFKDGTLMSLNVLCRKP